MPLVTALRRHRQMDPSGSSEVEFKASLTYRESSKTTRAVIQRNTKGGGGVLTTLAENPSLVPSIHAPT